MKVAETINTLFQKGHFDLFWLYPASVRIFVSQENSWNQLNNWKKSSLQ
jgi:hypothetical protein